MLGLKSVILAMFAASVPLGGAWACPTWYTLANGTTADADQVMSNFNNILQCPNFVGSISAGNGSSLVEMTLYGGGTDYTDADLVFSANDNTNYRGLGTFYFDTGGQNEWFAGRPYKGAGPSTSDAFVIGRQGGISSHNRDTASGTFSTFFVTILSNGNTGIGTTSPGYTLHVNGSVAGTSAYNNLSDVRLKKNIVPIAGALAIIGQLQGVRFDWRKPDERIAGKNLNLPVNDPQVGFIAQEVQKVLPQAVTLADSGDHLMSTQESKVVPVLVEAVKQLAAMNRSQANRIQKLEQRMNALDRRTPKHMAANQIPTQ